MCISCFVYKVKKKNEWNTVLKQLLMWKKLTYYIVNYTDLVDFFFYYIQY